MSLPNGFLDEIRARVPLTQMVGKRIRLVKSGREWGGCCPFHNEKTPSFTVNDTKGFFHCFGCGAHGDVIGFVQRHDHLSFIEAVELLANEAGLAMPRQTPENRAQEDRFKTLHRAMELADMWFREQLFLPAGRAGLDYFRRRGLDKAAIERFGLGFAPADAAALPRYLEYQGVKPDDMLALGLTRKPDDGRAPYSFFRNRVLFPVGDRKGRTIAFGARLLEGDGPKYINSPDSPLFHKGETLYGISRARAAALDNRPVIIAEGYMDVIALVQAGFDGAVAPLGTAITESQITALWRLYPADCTLREPVLCLDGDSAGQRAASRAIERALPLLKAGHSLRIAFMPTGEDPDSLLRTSGKAGFAPILAAARPLVEQLWQMLLTTHSTDTPESLASLKQAIEQTVTRIADKMVQDLYRTDLLARFRGIRAEPSAHSSGTDWKKPAGRFQPAISPQHRPNLAAQHKRSRLFLICLLNHPDFLRDYESLLTRIKFETAEMQQIAQSVLVHYSSEPDITRASLHAYVKQEHGIQALETLCTESSYQFASFARPEAEHAQVATALADLARLLQQEDFQRERRALAHRAGDSAEAEAQLLAHYRQTGIESD